eukprot:12573593-Alexandrium_andersonii.AAC.1
MSDNWTISRRKKIEQLGNCPRARKVLDSRSRSRPRGWHSSWRAGYSGGRSRCRGGPARALPGRG